MYESETTSKKNSPHRSATSQNLHRSSNTKTKHQVLERIQMYETNKNTNISSSKQQQQQQLYNNRGNNNINNTIIESRSGASNIVRKDIDSSSMRYIEERLEEDENEEETEMSKMQQQQNVEGGEEAAVPAGEAVVTPELLVDALSGHEDGLLAIAERLMEHYERGYDVMGEAIIDAFADVQKLFQHVVEAAHMEGAAFEASRREAEMEALKKSTSGLDTSGIQPQPQSLPNSPNQNAATPAAGGPIVRHDEFIDDDVRDVLLNAVKLGQPKKEAGQYLECYELYEEACNSASALLPVDSDHRGRLQLSIARAESMSPDRACAILKYAMDDVLRSGQNLLATSASLDQSKRSDCVLKPQQRANYLSDAKVQSTEEVLASLVQEMKEVLSAPMYENSPVTDVATRFWKALSESQKHQTKNYETLEQSLGKLKGDFLLARAEWEEKLSEQTQQTETLKKKYHAVQNQLSSLQSQQYLDHAKTKSDMHTTSNTNHVILREHHTANASATPSRGAPSAVSLGSGIAQHARSLVGGFSCMGNSTKDDNHRSSPGQNSSSCTPPSITKTSSSMDSYCRSYDRRHKTYNQKHTFHRLEPSDV